MELVTIVGSGRQHSSLDAYSYEFSQASGFKRIMLRLDKNQLTSSYSGNLEVYDGLFVRGMGSGWAFNVQFGKYVFRKLRDKISESVVHYTTFGLPLLTQSYRDIVTIHDLFFLKKGDEAYGGVLNISEHFLKRFINFNNIVAPSYCVKNELEAYGFTGNIKVIYMPAPEGLIYMENKSYARSSLNLPESKKLILSISSNLKRKNLRTVVETMRMLGEEYHLVRVGSPVDGATNYANVSVDTLNRLYNACDVMLFPTLDEGYGKPVVEAFSTGLPVVASNIPIMREIANNSALLVDPTPKSCAEGVFEAIQNEDKLRKMGFERAKLFTREKFVSDVKSLYNSVNLHN